MISRAMPDLVLLDDLSSLQTLPITANGTTTPQLLGAIADIRRAFGSLEEMTQHNAALVEETNAAIEQTEAQANDLDGLVGRFRAANAEAIAA